MMKQPCIVYLRVSESNPHNSQSSPVEILQTLNFILQYLLWLDIVPGVKSVKLSNVVMLLPLDIQRSGSKFLKRKKELRKDIFL